MFHAGRSALLKVKKFFVKMNKKESPKRSEKDNLHKVLGIRIQTEN